ncbi:glycine--tRNA ligase beta subunit [Algimonas arctica]|uniref:Glycine--tRNA ligase beta subunit n=1 Tax=Algimonas arctica TaxID=1479486 RepID=A0A8J3CKM0_9PROT|nr:glycine--tRNA ligase subunit beta [Algimonas arctica]GHA82321.1 glycine--tRNA ligase beta subunit [Algimonas arctica]
MFELLLEIFSEEIPARMQVRAGQDLVKAMDAGLKAAGLSPKDSHALTGPRRLTYVTQVELRSPDVSEERKGPRVGSPERALEGFMRGAGITDISQAETRSDKKGEYYVAVLQSEGRDTSDILTALIPEVMTGFSWPKSMKSGDSDFRWVRPLRGLTVLLDGQSLDGITVGGITSDAMVHGHRQMGPGPFPVTTLADYRAALETDGHVMIYRSARRARVLEQAKAACAEAGLELVEDEGLLDEVTGLVEWPVALLGDMDPTFLELPDEVIRLTLKSHQKTFTVRDADGNLAPNFVIMANLETPDNGATIKAGNAKVISARLSDARFFQQQDRQKNLIDYYDQLDEVVFHKKLGSVRDKADRVAALAREIAPHVGADPDLAEQAAKLAKCDLVTQTVIEATSLQGQVGRWMYEAEGGNPDIAVAIEDHYKPQGPSDAVPTNPVAIAVALADKIDTLVGFWAIGEKPTGSKDPFALRRAALGVVRLILSRNLASNLNFFAMLSFYHLNAQFPDDDRMASFVHKLGGVGDLWKIVGHAKADNSFDAFSALGDGFSKTIVDTLLSFLLDRLRVYLRDQGQRHDVIDAVIAQGGDDLLAISQRVEALGAFLSNADGENLVQGYKRAANILRAERKKGKLDLASFDTLSGFTADPAAALAKALANTRPSIDAALNSGDYPAALSSLADLREPIDAFFEDVVVNSDDPDERARRLALLSAVVETFHQIADFSRLDG